MIGFKLYNFDNQTNSLLAGWHPAHKKGEIFMKKLSIPIYALNSKSLDICKVIGYEDEKSLINWFLISVKRCSINDNQPNKISWIPVESSNEYAVVLSQDKCISETIQQAFNKSDFILIEGGNIMELLRSFKNQKGEVTLHKLYASYLVMKKQDGTATTRRVKQWELALSNYEAFIADLQSKNESEELFYPKAIKDYSEAIQLLSSTKINKEEIMKALWLSLEKHYVTALEATGGVIPEFAPVDFIKWFHDNEPVTMIMEALYS